MASICIPTRKDFDNKVVTFVGLPVVGSAIAADGFKQEMYTTTLWPQFRGTANYADPTDRFLG